MIDYKKILKSRKTRNKILDMLSFVPDEIMVKLQYRIKTGRKLNLKNPRRWTEKTQWYKLYYRNPLMIQCVDKYDVREYIKKCGLEKILNYNYGVYNNIDDIDFKSLPDRFVIKDTLGGGSNSVIVIKDKSSIEIDELKAKLNDWLKQDPRKPTGGREWPYYSGKKHRIIIDKYLEDKNGELIDYKFFCFNGVPNHSLVISDRFTGEKLDLYSIDWKRMHVVQSDCPRQTDHNFPKPENYDEMVNIAKRLSKGFPHVRIDLYNVDGKIYFGEMTFFSASGYYIFEPDKFDFILGKKFVLPSTLFSGGVILTIKIIYCAAGKTMEAA